MFVTESELLTEIADELTLELSGDATFNANILTIKVKDAYRKVRQRRCYTNSSMVENQIIDDLHNNYFNSIKDVALYNYSKLGGYFESYHSENGTTRTFVDEDKVLANVKSFVRFL